MTENIERDIPIYFGGDEGVFGMYAHATDAGMPAALLCPPLGQEMIRAHRIYRQLAQALAARGMSVLRFDYRGTGDSAGDSSDFSWQLGVEDTLEAAAELRRRSGQGRVVAFGARLGATLAMQTAAPARFERMALWDPVCNGRAFVAAQDALQQELPTDRMRFARPRPASTSAGQWLGFAIGDTLRPELARIDAAPPRIDTLVLDSRPAGREAEWTALRSSNRVRVVEVQPATVWESLDRLEHAILLPAMVQSATDFLCGTA